MPKKTARRRAGRQQPKPTPEKKVNKPPVRTPNTDWHDTFLASLSGDGNVSKAAKAAHVDRSYAYDQKAADSAFSTQWESAKKLGLDSLTDVAIERAHNGSETLIIFLMKAHEPEKYRERHDVTTGGKPLPIAVIKMDIEEL
jgi:hypothetical protein